MGAPTGSFDVVSVTRPWDTGVAWPLYLEPAINMVAGRSVECCLIVAHRGASGVQVCAAACSGVREGGWLVSEMQRGSISPIRIGSPWELTWIGSEPSAKVISIRHVLADASASRQRKVGGVISGGKMEPSSG